MSKQNIILITLLIISGTIVAAHLNLWQSIMIIAIGVIWLGWQQKWIDVLVKAWVAYLEQKRQADIVQQKAVEEEQRRQVEQGKLFKFKTITINTRRTKRQARYQTEDLGNGVTLEMVYIQGGTLCQNNLRGFRVAQPVTTWTSP